MYQFEGENFKKLAERVINEKRKQWAYRRITTEEPSDEEDNQSSDKRDYPRLVKFMRNQALYRPVYYLLDERFY